MSAGHSINGRQTRHDILNQEQINQNAVLRIYKKSVRYTMRPVYRNYTTTLYKNDNNNKNNTYK